MHEVIIDMDVDMMLEFPKIQINSQGFPKFLSAESFDIKYVLKVPSEILSEYLNYSTAHTFMVLMVCNIYNKQ